MDIVEYQKSKDFNRNEAIYVLHTIDKTPLEEISLNFSLAIDELKEILNMHSKYQAILCSE